METNINGGQFHLHMKLLAINGSPRADRGNTAVILEPFLKGAEEAGAEVELLFTSKLEIQPCNGEFSCWTKTPGRCGKKDDMAMVLEKFRECDVLVLATPLYVDSFTGPMKNLLDRLIPILEPLFEVRDERTRHPVREGYGGKKLVLISVCGLYEMENFDILVDHFKAFAGNYDGEIAGILLRPHGGGLIFMKDREDVKTVLDACHRAGKELVEGGGISQDVRDRVSAPLFTREQHIDIVNASFQKALDKL
jgi:multimeric flavodoxin WrbA